MLIFRLLLLREVDLHTCFTHPERRVIFSSNSHINYFLFTPLCHNTLTLTKAPLSGKYPWWSHRRIFIIFSQQTLGRPKGVMIEHGMACNLLRWPTFKRFPSVRVGCLTSVSFDPLINETWGMLSRLGLIFKAVMSFVLKKILSQSSSKCYSWKITWSDWAFT